MAKNYDIEKGFLGSIFNGEIHYMIPDYQRPYEWKGERVEELWNDVVAVYVHDTSAKSEEYLLGPIVVANLPDDKQWIVDGQQRLVTFTLLFCAIREFLYDINFNNNKKNSKEDKQYIQKLIEDIDNFINIKNEVVITLNDNANEIFERIQKNKINHQDLIKERRASKHPSTRLLIDNYMILKTEVEILCKKCKLNSTGVELINAIAKLDRIIEDIKKKNLFVHITIYNTDYTYEVFQSLNSKGQPLTQADLIKSYLLKQTNKNNDIKNKWEKITENRKPKEVDQFLYESLLSRSTDTKDIIKRKLSKTIKKKYKNKEDIDQYLKELLEDNEIINWLDNPKNLPDVTPQRIKHAFYGMEQIKAVYIRRPIIAACRKWEIKNHKTQKLADCLVKFFFMYRTIGLNDIDKLKRISTKITSQIIADDKLEFIFWTILKDENKHITNNVNKEEFLTKFEDEIFNLKDDVAKYILISLEHECNKPGGIETNIVGSNLELEHIFPQKPKDDCPESINLSNHLNRLGNLTLLPSGWNKILLNQCFKDKRNGVAAKNKRSWEKTRNKNPQLPLNKEDVSYLKSGLKLNEHYLQKYDTWVISNIENREEDLRILASKVWDLTSYIDSAEKPINTSDK